MFEFINHELDADQASSRFFAASLRLRGRQLYTQLALSMSARRYSNILRGALNVSVPVSLWTQQQSL
ncbi:MAG: hypothetical protein ACSHWQ_06900 [Spongiibacteraceae bacterium]